MRRRLHRLAGLAVVLAVLVPAALSWSGALQEAADRLTDVVVQDPGISRDLVVVGLTDPRLWPAPSTSGETEVLDTDRLRLRALVGTIEALLAQDARLVVLTDTITNEDLTRDDARALVEVLASGRVLMPYLDDVPVAAAEGSLRRFRPPLSVTSSLPLAHAVVEDPGPGDRVRTMAVTERWSADGETYEFVALPLAAVATVAQVPIDRTDDAIRAGALTVPLEDGRLRINWTDRLVNRVPGTVLPAAWRDDLPFVDAAGLVDDGRGPSGHEVAGQVALVGTVDPLQARYVAVPGGPQGGIPELWVHANALNTVLVGAPLGPASLAELVLWLSVAALVMVAVALRRPLVESAVWVAPAAVLALVAVAARGGAGVLLDPVALLLALALAWGGTFVVRHAVEGRQRRRVADLFRRYVPDAVAEQLIEEEVSVDDLAAGTRTDVTVLFCDLRGFTAQAGTLEPGRVRDLLNVYYRHTTRVVLEHGGTVMQYVGDEVFAVFGAPLAQPDHAERAIAAAIGMQAVATDVATELATMEIAPVAYGIGVNSGSVVAAHVGDAARTQYAVVGDTVNVGARLCAQAGPGEVVLSADVLARLAEPPEVVPLGSVPLKGVDRELPIHRLVQGSTRQEPDG